MKHAAWILCTVLFLGFAATALAQVVGVPASSSVAYLNPGRYLVFQGNYVNDKGDVETGLVKYDSQTGLTWLLRPAPATNETAAGYNWVPVKN